MNLEALLCAESRRLTTLRLELLEQHPFWGHLMLHLRLVPALDLPVFVATDGVRRVWHNPRFTRHLDLRQLGFVLAHAVVHHALENPGRRNGRDPHLWNHATDYAINRIVAGIGLYRSPDGCYPELGEVRILHDPRFAGLTAEQIYDRLHHERPPPPRPIRLQLPGHGEGHGVADHGGGIDVHLPQPLTPAEHDERLDRLEAAVRAFREGQPRGELPAGVERLVDGLQPGKVPWPTLLARCVGEVRARQEYSLAHPSKRWLAEDLLVPGPWSEAPGPVVVAVDTSASIAPAMLQAMAAELARLHALLAEVTVLVADAQVHVHVPARDLPAFLRAGRFPGGGGTSHEPVFRWLAERRLQPDLFIGLTDLHSQFPVIPPPFPVLWVVPPAHGKAPWGRVVEVEL